MESTYAETIKRLQDGFQDYKNTNEKNRAELQIEVAGIQKDIAECQRQGDSWTADDLRKNLSHTQEIIKHLEELAQYERIPSLEDYEYRFRQRGFSSKDKESFSDKLKGIINRDEMLCFHGTNIAAAKHILEGHSISSGATRLGYTTSFNPKGCISVTNISAVDSSVEGYMNLTTNMYQPAGCLFVVKARDSEEYDWAGTAMLIHDIDFKIYPDRLVAVITTPENIERVKHWAECGGIDVEKIMDFDKFVSKAKAKSLQKATAVLTRQQSPSMLSELGVSCQKGAK